MGNVIAGNGGTGIAAIDFSSSRIRANFIGTNAAGVALGNTGSGLFLRAGSAGNTVGGTAAGDGNVIAFNTRNGVTIGTNAADATTVNNAVLGNSIYANTLLGIDLGNNGATANDAGDADNGPNNLQNAPVLATAKNSATTTTITGSLGSTPSTTFRVEFFSSPSGAQGQTFLGFLNVATNAGGTANFTFTPTSLLAAGQVVTATATDPLGNTSEFSAAATVTKVPDNVTAVTLVTRSGFTFNRRTRRFTQTVTIKNLSGALLTGPLSLVLDNLSAGVSLFNASGSTTAFNPPAGSPYINVSLPGGVLANGGSATVTLEFTNPNALAIAYNTRVLAGTGQR